MNLDPDDVVEEWHTTPDEIDSRNLLEFMSDRLGWTHEQVQRWIATSEGPGDPGEIGVERVEHWPWCQIRPHTGPCRWRKK